MSSNPEYSDEGEAVRNIPSVTETLNNCAETLRMVDNLSMDILDRVRAELGTPSTPGPHPLYPSKPAKPSNFFKERLLGILENTQDVRQRLEIVVRVLDDAFPTQDNPNIQGIEG